MRGPRSSGPHRNGAPDLCLRRVAVYPAELRAQCLAVQRPNESNPQGVCCDIVRPVFSGVVYHANYLRFMERARTSYLRLLGTDHRSLFEDTGSEAPGFTFVVRSMALDSFKQPRQN